VPGGGDVKATVYNSCADYNSYRAARVKSLFNAESGAEFKLDAELPIDDSGWAIGIIVGPSGSGKTSLGRVIWPGVGIYEGAAAGWPPDAPIVDAIAPGGDFNDVTSALSAVGLGDVPTWLRPYRVLSNGEKFRADLARIISEGPPRVIVDEFTSVVDRQIARFGALAFAKAWKRLNAAAGNQAILLTPHYDIIEWAEPDWVYDTATGKYTGRGLWRRPRFDLDVWETDWRYWPLFEPHHYLKAEKMVAAKCYVGAVEGEPVVHAAFSTRPGLKEARACRLVVMPEWQGAGVGTRFLNHLCDMWLRGENRFSKPMPTLFHTSHPGLSAALRRDRRWVQVSAVLSGGSRAKSAASLLASYNNGRDVKADARGYYGGHWRAVQGFRYLGEYSPRLKEGA
jgi:GNAT superfamily N-acetyltransferase